MKARFKKRLKQLLVRWPALVRYAGALANEASSRADVFARVPPQLLFTGANFENFLLRSDPKKNRYILTDCHFTGSAIPNVKKIIASVDDLAPDEIAGSIFYVYFTCDSDALP